MLFIITSQNTPHITFVNEQCLKLLLGVCNTKKQCCEKSVADPDPPDPHVLGLLDPDPLVRGMDPDPDPEPSIIKKK
jgi:hypothetical protein